MAKLNTYKNKYTDAFIDAFVSDIEAAQNMPGDQARSLEHENLRVDLVGLNRTCRMNFQMLKGYIEEAFAEDKWVMNFDAAGWQYYEKASENNWDSTEEMMTMAVNYVTANAAKLQADGFMPNTFAATITASGESFSTKLQDFLAAQENARMGTQNKLTGNNNCYTQGIAICRDGSTVAEMENDPAMGEQFSFDALLAIVSPKGASTLVVEVTNGETQMPMTGAELTITGSDKTGSSNGEGRIEVSQLPSSTIQGFITADGFGQQAFTATLTGGTTRVKITMTPLFTGEMTVGAEGVSSGQPAVGSMQ